MKCSFRIVYGDGDRADHAQLSWPPGGGIMLGPAREAGEDGNWPVLSGANQILAASPAAIGADRSAC